MSFKGLTPRERQVAEMLCLGLKNGEIAAVLEISIKTIDTHRMNIMRRLKVRNNVELLRLALRQGWVSVPLSAEVLEESFSQTFPEVTQ